MDILLCQNCGWMLSNPVDDCSNCGDSPVSKTGCKLPAWSDTVRTGNWTKESLDYLPLKSSSDNLPLKDSLPDGGQSPHLLLLNSQGDFFERGPEALRSQAPRVGRVTTITSQNPPVTLPPEPAPPENTGFPATGQHAMEAVRMLTSLLDGQKQSLQPLQETAESMPKAKRRRAAESLKAPPTEQTPLKRRSFSRGQAPEKASPASSRLARKGSPEEEPEERSVNRRFNPSFNLPAINAGSQPVIIVVAAALIIVGALMLFAAWMSSSQSPPSAEAVNVPEIAGIYEMHTRIQGESSDDVWKLTLHQNGPRLEAQGQTNEGPYQLKGTITANNTLAFTIVRPGDPDLIKHPLNYKGAFSIDELGRVSLKGKIEAPVRQTTFAKTRWMTVPGSWSARMIVSGAVIGN